MNAVKNVLIGLGVISVILFIVLMVVGIRVVSTIVVYVVGTIAILALIGLIIYYGRKLFNREDKQP